MSGSISLQSLHEVLSPYNITTQTSSTTTTTTSFPMREALLFLSADPEHGCRNILDFHGVGDYKRLDELMMMETLSNATGEKKTYAASVLRELHSLLLAAVGGDKESGAMEKVLINLVRLVSGDFSAAVAAAHTNNDDDAQMNEVFRNNGLLRQLWEEKDNECKNLFSYLQSARSMSLTERYPHAQFKANVVEKHCKPVKNFSRLRVGEKKLYEVFAAAPFVDLVASALTTQATEEQQEQPCRKEDVCVVDIGAGQGYLQLAIRDRNLHSLVAVERDSHQVDGAKGRVESYGGHGHGGGSDSAFMAAIKASKGESKQGGGEQEEPNQKCKKLESQSTATEQKAEAKNNQELTPMNVCFLEVNGRTTGDSFETAVNSAAVDALAGGSDNIASSNKPKGYVLCNLHACGNLSMNTLRLFSDWTIPAATAKDTAARKLVLGTVNIGCCYNLIVDKDEHAIKVRSHLGKTVIADSATNTHGDDDLCCDASHKSALPMSNIAINLWNEIHAKTTTTTPLPDCLLTHKMKSTACQAPQRYSSELKGTGFGADLANHVETLTSNFNRAAIEVLLMDKCGLAGGTTGLGRLPKANKKKKNQAGQTVVEKKLGADEKEGADIERPAHVEDFVQYYLKVVESIKAKKQQHNDNDEGKSFVPLPAAEVSVWYEVQWNTMFLKSCAMWAVRAVGAAVAEAMLLVDRCLFVEEATQGRQKVYLVPIFDPVKSPRGFAVVALPPAS